MKIKLAIKIVLSVLLTILILVFTVPFIFEDEIAKKTLKVLNQKMNAEISIEELDLTLYRHFPDFTLELKKLNVKNKNDFQDTELLSIDRFEIILDLMSVLSGNLEIKSIGIVNSKINVLVDEQGKANYNITKLDTTAIASDKEVKTVEDQKQDDSSSNFKISLNNFFIKNANIHYEDKKGNIRAVITNLNHSTTGDFSSQNLVAKTKTDIEDIYFSQGGITLLKEASFYANINAKIDNLNSTVEVEENEIGLNQIKLAFDGRVKLPKDEPINVNLNFNTSDVAFKDLLSMIPGNFKNSIKDLKTSGNFKISGNIEGDYQKELTPALNVTLLVENGFVQYPTVPKPINDINIKIDVSKKQSTSLDDIVVNVSKFNINFGGNPIKFNSKIKTPISDPQIEANLLANVNLNTLKDVVPLPEKDNVTGTINSNVSLKGNLSYIEKEQYDKFDAKGNIDLYNIIYSSEKLPFKKIQVNKLLFEFSPYTLNLSNMDVLVGQSDLKINGKINNYLGYIFKDKNLSGNINVNSNKLLLDEFTSKEEKTTKDDVSTDNVTTPQKNVASNEPEISAVNIPDRINFSMNLNLDKVNYGNIKMQNVNGKLGIKEQIAFLNKVSINLLEGSVLLNGNYNSKNTESPKVDMDLDISNIDIQSTIKTFPSVSKIAPQIIDVEGRVSSNMSLKTALNQKMSPDYKTLYSRGKIQTSNLKVKTLGALKKIGEAIKSKDLQDPNLNDLSISYTIENGVLNVSPIVIKSRDIRGTIEGKTYIENQTLDLMANFEIPRKELGNSVNKVIDDALELAKKNKLNVSVSEKINVRVKISGPATSPNYALTYGPDNVTSLEEYAKKEAQNIVDKASKEATKNAQKKLEEESKKLYDKNKGKIDNAVKNLFK